MEKYNPQSGKFEEIKEGGSGSGNFGHSGRVGAVGGSGGEGGSGGGKSGVDAIIAQIPKNQTFIPAIERNIRAGAAAGARRLARQAVLDTKIKHDKAFNDLRAKYSIRNVEFMRTAQMEMNQANKALSVIDAWIRNDKIYTGGFDAK